MKAKIFFSVLFLSQVIWAGEFINTPGLVNVRSQYFDRAKKEKVWIQGVGTVLDYDGRTLIITASHVSQGDYSLFKKQPPLINGRTVNIVNRYANLDTPDIEVLEVSGLEIKPLGRTSKGFSAFHVDKNTLALWKSDPKLLKHVITTNYETSAPLKWTRPPGELYLTPPWQTEKIQFQPNLDKEKEGEEYFQRDRDSFFNGALNGSFGVPFRAPFRVIPGFSGMPALHSFDENCNELHDSIDLRCEYYIVGVVTEYLRFSRDSNFTGFDELKNILMEYIFGHSSNKSQMPVKWRMRNGLLYRVFGGLHREVIFAQKNTGASLTGKSGGGTSGGSGGGTSGGSGGRTTGETILSTEEALTTYNIRPGMIYYNQPTIGFQVTYHDSKPQNFYADMRTFDFIRFNRSYTTIKPIPAGYNIGPLVKDRVGTTTNFFNLKSTTPNSFHQMVYKDGRVHVEIKNLGSERAFLTFDLDEKGRIKGSTQSDYLPNITINDSRTGQPYTVHLNFVYFSDPLSTDLGLDNKKANNENDTMILVERNRDGAKFQIVFRMNASVMSQ